jgi:hypothetical protein
MTAPNRVVNEVSEWYRSKSLRNVTLLDDLESPVLGEDEGDDYKVVSCLKFRSEIKWTLSAEVWVCDDLAIGLGIGSHSDLEKWTGSSTLCHGFLAGFEPHYVEISAVLSLLNLCASGNLRVVWPPVLRYVFPAQLSVGQTLDAAVNLREWDRSNRQKARISERTFLGSGFTVLPWN